MSTEGKLYLFQGSGCGECVSRTGLYTEHPGRPHPGCTCQIKILDMSFLGEDFFTSEVIEEIMEREVTEEVIEEIKERKKEEEEKEEEEKEEEEWEKEEKKKEEKKAWVVDEGKMEEKKRAWEENYKKLFTLIYEELRDKWIEENGEENLTDEINEQLQDEAHKLALERMKT